MADSKSIIATDGNTFTRVESVDLARLVFKRFGQNAEASVEAWRRMLQNDCNVQEFMELVEYPEHTPHCGGWCRGWGDR